MANNNTSLDQLKGFLNKLFQFDSQDLDFGVYKILHYKRKEIANFIDQLLVDKVKEQLQTLSADESKQIKEQIADLEKDDIIKGWLEAEAEEKKTLEKFGKDKINQYAALKAKATEATVSVETENQIYNHLTLFFSRYYDKGDFISKRRFGKNEKYMVPYNGEETHFHWANHDQYYIKSSETFNHYAFKVQTADGNLVVNFKLHDAQLEQGNVKAEETNFFMLADKSPEIKEKDDSDLQFILANKQPAINDKEITIYFEYRPLADDEKKKVKGNSKQDTLDEIAFEYLKKEFSTNPLFANLWKPAPAGREQEGKPLLLKKLQHYTRKNKHDFFIHKNLKSFLERELDYYIKSELVNVDDLYVTDSDTHFDRLKHNLKTIKVFKSIADTIIAFVSQIEDFQKKLWEKKKFVLSTEWVITIDRLVEYIGEEAAKPILEEVIKNEKQVAEWKELFGEKAVPKNKDDFKADLHTWRKLPIDTKNFTSLFKSTLLNILSVNIQLDTYCEGSIIESENYHLLTAIKELHGRNIDCAYYDPPYNTGGSEFIYKNTFQHSSWASMMDNRLELTKDLLSDKGVNIIAIDDYELFNLTQVSNKIYGSHNLLGNLIVEIKPSGRTNDDFLATSHEYNLFYALDTTQIKVNFEELTDSQKEEYKHEDTISKYKWRDFLRTGGYSTPEERPNSFYPIYYNEQTKHISIKELKGYEIIFPVDSNGKNRVWRKTPPSLQKHIDIGDIQVTRKETKFKVEIKDRIKLGKRPKSVWVGAQYDASSHGTKHIKKLFSNPKFSYPKSINSVIDAINLVTNDESIVLDIFGGSGTTAEAVMRKNENTQNLKFILGEQNAYVHNTIIPRVKKIAYSFDWKDGLPKTSAKDGTSSMNGLGVFFKYQRLEQYEEALENIAFKASEDTLQKALEFDQYIPKYFLEFETKGSQSLVNTAAMQDPWDYKLKVWDGFTYDTEQAVDLVETFNYLIGLHMQKCITKEINGKKYQFVYGHNNANKNILVVWRSVKAWSLEDYKADAAALKEEFKAFAYDLLYINDQAHIEGYQPIEEVFRNKMLS
ncbi:adenine specific DNA methylase Mod [Belliella baltica DSM 15883]|uniref:Adenine specific DNA methylase Mod n=2 Tax=Belliella TaxID=232244 RepID=I3Z7Y6_BELBD|nr:adenine specific DNA methylase Mod [Belliella baltica DSM 15883]